MTTVKRMGPLEIKRLRNEALLNTTLMSSSVHTKTEVMGMEIFAERLPGKQALKEVNRFAKMFQTKPFDWSVWLANFWEKDGEQIIQPKVIHVKSTLTSEVDNVVREHVLLDADTSIEEGKLVKEDWRGFGYLITLNNQIDFEAEENNLIRKLEEKGIWDQTLRHLVTEQKINRKPNSDELKQAVEQLDQIAGKYMAARG